MIRISTISSPSAWCWSPRRSGSLLYSVAGISGSESAIVALTALTFLILYNAVSMRLRDRTDVGGQIADLSRGTADLARQVAEFGRRLAASKGKLVSANSSRRGPHSGRGRRDQRTGRCWSSSSRPPSPAMTKCWPRRRVSAGGGRAPPPGETATTPAFEPPRLAAASPQPPRPPAAPRPRSCADPAQPGANPRRGEKRGRGKPASTSICSRW